jgi:pantothenate kinase
VALEHIDPYPWFLNKPLDLVVNEQLVRTRITATEWADHWRPFLGRLYDLFERAAPKRFVIAFAGPPGSGKSIIAEQIHWIMERSFFHKKAHSIALPMDGFHYPNSYLETHTRKLPDGREIPLFMVKGQPDTIDVKTLRRYLQMLVARPEHMPWPGYSRFSHDVVPEKHHISGAVNLVLVEGNYLLVNRGPFAGIPDMFDLRVYVECPAAKIMANLMERHIRGGKEIEEAKTWVKRIDLPNARVAEATRPNADVILEKDAFDDVVSVTWKGEESSASVAETVATMPATPPASIEEHLERAGPPITAADVVPTAALQAGGALPAEGHLPVASKPPAGATSAAPH